MILKGAQRGSGLELAAHLMNGVENDHVEVHALRGFTAEDLRGAFQEVEAISKGTRCRQAFFSVSFSPPETERVPIAFFESVIDNVEAELGLAGQPRAIVFHEKNGRRHAHAVWSRIDVAEMKAINLPFYKRRLNVIAKDLFLEHGWRLPEGFVDRARRDPRNFTLAEWQQAKRRGKDPRETKRVFREAWSVSDSGPAFANALQEKGYMLARGDRRDFVAVDCAGEIYAVPRWTGIKTKEARQKLGDPRILPSVEDAKALIAAGMLSTVSRWESELAVRQRERRKSEDAERRALAERQRKAREELRQRQEQRALREKLARQYRFRSGLRGLWDRLRGRYARIVRECEIAAWQAHRRDQAERDDLVFRHLEERRALKRAHRRFREKALDERRNLRIDRARFERLRNRTSRSAGPSPER